MTERKDRGVVLVAVLFALAIMTVLVVAVTSLARSSIASQALEARRLSSELALRSGLEAGKAAIVAMSAPQRIFLNAAPVTLGLGGGLRAEIRIRDAAGLADLNRSDVALLEAILMDSLADTEALRIMAEVASWRSAAEEKAKAKTPPPAVRSEGETPAPPPAPVVFVALEQLLAMAAPAAAPALSGRLTLFNPAGLINPLAAPDAVLAAVPGITPADISTVAAARRARAPGGGQGLGRLVERLKPFLTLKEPSVFVIEVRLFEGPGVIANSSMSAVVQLAEEGPMAFRTLWVSGQPMTGD
jgi:general secretion pathway protein K